MRLARTIGKVLAVGVGLTVVGICIALWYLIWFVEPNTDNENAAAL